MNLVHRLFPNQMARRDITIMLVIFCAYLATALIGTALFRSPAVIFPAAAVALASLVVGGIRFWPAILTASIVGHLISGSPLLWAFTLSIAHVIQAVTGAYLLEYFKFDPVFRRTRDMFAFMFTGAVISMIVPSVGLATMYLNYYLFEAPLSNTVSWGTWWIGVFVCILIFGSFLIRSLAKIDFVRTRIEWAEIAAGIAATVVLSYLLYWTNAQQISGGVVILLYIVPFVWCALRLGMRFTLLAFAITTIIALTGVFYGHQESSIAISRRIIVLEVWIATLASIFYLFVAMVEERMRSARQLNTQLERVHTLLEESKRQDRTKSDFIAVFAHELRNPLAPIVSSIELLKLKWSSDPDLASIINIMDDRTRTIVRLLDDLLDISRISEGRLRLKKELSDVGSIVRKSALSIEGHMRSRGQTFALSLPKELLMLDVDPVRIEQIVSNLLNNASKFTPNGGTIALNVRHVGDSVQISVKDNGVGIAPEMLPRIFEPFLQIETKHRVNEGLGIGLSLTQKLVEVHGGSIEAKSEGPGKGAEFIVTLPLVRKVEESLLTNESSMNISVQKTALRILVVDDNEAAANGLGTLLKHVGNTVDFAYVGADVAEKVNEFKPDVIVLDIGLPDISGYEVAEQLRAGGYRGRVIALTGYGQDEDKKKAEAAGFDHHLTKPVGLADLQAVLIPQAA